MHKRVRRSSNQIRLLADFYEHKVRQVKIIWLFANSRDRDCNCFSSSATSDF